MAMQMSGAKTTQRIVNRRANLDEQLRPRFTGNIITLCSACHRRLHIRAESPSLLERSPDEFDPSRQIDDT